jgi:hypothetical protein
MGVTQVPDPIQEPDYVDGTVASPLGEVNRSRRRSDDSEDTGVEQMTGTSSYLRQHNELAMLIRGIALTISRPSGKFVPNQY